MSVRMKRWQIAIVMRIFHRRGSAGAPGTMVFVMFAPKEVVGVDRSGRVTQEGEDHVVDEAFERGSVRDAPVKEGVGEDLRERELEHGIGPASVDLLAARAGAGADDASDLVAALGDLGADEVTECGVVPDRFEQPDQRGSRAADESLCDLLNGAEEVSAEGAGVGHLRFRALRLPA